MANYQIDGALLTGIADAIRAKTGGTATMTPAAMATEISDISSAPAIRLVPHVEDLDTGYVYADSVWHYDGPGGTNYSDVYRVESGKSYFLSLGDDVGNRFRALFTTTDTSTATANISGTMLSNTTDPEAYKCIAFRASGDGFVTVSKTQTQSGIKTYMYLASDIVDNLGGYQA